MATQLTSLKINEVSIVDDGANQLAAIVLAKRAGQPDGEQHTEQEKKIMAEKTEPVVEKTAPPVVDIQKQIDDAVEKHRVEMQKQVDAANIAVAKAQADATAAQEIAKQEQDKRETLEFTKQATSDIPNLTGTPEEKGAVLKAIYGKLSEAERDGVMKLLKAGDAAQKKAFAPIGGSPRGDDGGDAKSKLESLAKVRAKEKGISFSKAIAEVSVEETELYSQAQAERLQGRAH